MKLLPIAVFGVLALGLAGGAPGHTLGPTRDVVALLPTQKTVLAGIDRARKRGAVPAGEAATDRAIVNRTAFLIRHLPSRRSAPLTAQLRQAAVLAGRLTAPRARSVFGQLAANNDYLVGKNPPADGTDINDADGVLYRYFSGRGFEFHPLGNFGALNADISGGRTDDATRLAEALMERGVPQPGGGTGWEYEFDYGGGRAPWLSGMAQAVAAQAFSGAAALGAGDAAKLNAAARAAYRTIPGKLTTKLAAGPWIKLYAFNSAVVFNAQLQTALSLKAYADATQDTAAAALSASMQRAALIMLPRFDTGFWSYYQLPSVPSPLDYQTYVVQLLNRLAKVDPKFTDAAVRFATYAKQPPAFRLASPGLGRVRFWLSKPATVTVRSPAGPTLVRSLYGGWYDLGWKLPARPGAYSVQLSARDWAGNKATVDALPIVRVGVKGAPGARAPTAPVGIVGQAPFAAGAGLDVATQAGLARARGLNTVRLAVPWPAGATAPDEATVTALQALKAGGRVVLELRADPLPADDAGRAALTAYAVALAGQVPGLRDILLGPAPTTVTAPAYISALALLHDGLSTAAPSVALGGELDGSVRPAATLNALGAAFGESEYPSPAMAELAFRPAPKATATAWTLNQYSKLTAGLETAFGGSAQTGATLPILADGLSLSTRIPAARMGSYPGLAPAGGTEADQAAAYTKALATAACLPTVTGALFERLVDGPAAGQQAGLYYADGAAKTSAAATGKAALEATRGILRICPGLGVPAAAGALVFPASLGGAPPSIRLGCVRDCLYLVTLEDAETGRPVLAARGAMNGGAVKTVKLPAASYPAGSYRLAVRLVAQTNPGAMTVQLSPVLSR